MSLGSARLIAATGAALLLLAACGGEEEKAFRPIAPDDPGPIHVHALGVNPRDGALFIATHTGLYRLEPGQSKAARVGELYQDTMGFTVVGPDRFVGSGHPDVGEVREKGLPPHLGLIESNDAGVTWESISLLGEADFHVLRTAGDRIYGFDSSNVRLMTSEDGGHTWEQRALPEGSMEQLVDLVFDPADQEHLVASGVRGLYESADGGATWSKLGAYVGLLAWPAPERLVLVRPDGGVLTSANRGNTWVEAGDTGGEPAALLAISDRELYAALHDGTIVRSSDGGASWVVRSAP